MTWKIKLNGGTSIQQRGRWNEQEIIVFESMQLSLSSFFNLCRSSQQRRNILLQMPKNDLGATKSVIMHSLCSRPVLFRLFMMLRLLRIETSLEKSFIGIHM
jgi:hypothetical protein